MPSGRFVFKILHIVLLGRLILPLPQKKSEPVAKAMCSTVKRIRLTGKTKKEAAAADAITPPERNASFLFTVARCGRGSTNENPAVQVGALSPALRFQHPHGGVT